MKRIAPLLATMSLVAIWTSVAAFDALGAQVIVSPTAGLVTTEAGAQAQFSIVLSDPPTDPVVISISSSNTQEGVAGQSDVVFTGADWNIPQFVSITGVNDLRDDGIRVYGIHLGPSISADPAYADLPVPIVVVMNLDDDRADIQVSPSAGLVTSESGGSGEFAVVLTSEPADDVHVPITSTDLTEGTVSADVLTFTTANWFIPQLVTVTGVDDVDVDGHRTYGIITHPAVSTDPVYAGWNAYDVTVMNLDDDSGTVGVLPEPPGGMLVLEAVRPNPQRGNALQVDFALPFSRQAQLDLVDIAGRRLETREVGTLGAGRHRVTLGDGGLRPGTYWIHLIQGSDRRATRVTVIR